MTDLGRQLLFWKRTDVAGLERLELRISDSEVRASGTVLCLEDGGFRSDHRWLLTRDWRAQSLEVERWGADGRSRVVVERAETGWRVDGKPRPDLDGAEEPDLSITPFCNTLPIRRTPTGEGASLTLDTAYVDGAAMTVACSKQRYDRIGADRLRFVDLGLSAGFEADLDVDEHGLILRYEHLWERIRPD